MNYTEFVAEAHRLAKKAVKLSFNGKGEPTGYWHGGEGEDRALISVRRGTVWLNVFLDKGSGGVVRETELPITSSQPLFAQEFESLPPIEGVFLRGSEAVGDFVKSNGWERTEPYNDNFPSNVPSEYEYLWQENCPLYTSGIVAVIGGWHFPWPDGDWYEREASELVVWVLEGAEPWVEVFKENEKYLVKQRIT
jgi:hypothetical protein